MIVVVAAAILLLISRNYFLSQIHLAKFNEIFQVDDLGDGTYRVLAYKEKNVDVESLERFGSKIKSLNLSICKFENFDFLDSLTSCEFLTLSYTKLTDKETAKIGSLAGLKQLWLLGCEIDDLGFKQLAKLENLEELYVGENKLSNKDDVLRMVEGNPELSHLDISGNNFEDERELENEINQILPDCVFYDTVR